MTTSELSSRPPAEAATRLSGSSPDILEFAQLLKFVTVDDQLPVIAPVFRVHLGGHPDLQAVDQIFVYPL
ncbi:hypothetical protein LE181_00300 [Streptomyces sp. SCA3-4]|uniref:hypothetical protein n=1 Tax=Streptomyces sichuanensis TaxID=2871810 RepID=UPI001CE25943|nr:hypothetical protein [Streptomyces sichuanensis]MCA6090623.1 hypothetical protein [Streptomyces sichuanensis]